MRPSVAVDPSGSPGSGQTATTGYAPADEKLLDLELQGQESARNAFVRDLKLALLFVLLFQLLILPRFVRLSDATQTNRTNLDTLKTQSNATHELRTVLESLQSVLKRGAVLTSKHLANMAEQLHQQASRLDSEIRELRNSAAPGPAPSRPNMIVQTTRAAEIRLLSDLSPEQTRQVASNDPQVFRAAISPIVRTKIIQPAFADLNSQLISLLRQPFAVGRQRVESVLEAQNRNLKSAGTDPDSIRRQLSAEQDRLNDIRFIMPESDLWWATVQSKEGFFDQQNVSSRNVTDELQRQLSRLNHENAATETKIAALLHDTEPSQEMLLQLATQRIAGARAHVTITRSSLFPQVQGDANFRGGKDASTQSKFNILGLTADAAFQLDLFGRLRRATEASRAELLATEDAQQTVILTLVSDVASDYFTLLQLDLELQITRDTVKTQEDSVKLTRLRLEHGIAAQLDVLQSQQVLAEANATIPDLERQIAQEENAISILLGNCPQAVPRGRPLVDQPLPPDVPPGLPSALIDRRPDLR